MPEQRTEHRWSWTRFFYGCVGAAGVEILRLSKALPVDTGTPGSNIYLYVTVSIAMVVLGGTFASAWEDDRPIKCIYIGATFPVWLSGWAHLAVH